MRGRPATLELRYGPDSYGRQQWGILGNGGNPDPATPREGRRPLGRKLLLYGKKRVTVPYEEVPANYVPAAAVIRRGRALSGITGRKGRAGGISSQLSKTGAQPWYAVETDMLECCRGKWNSQCSGEMRRYWEEHRWRRRLAGQQLTLRRESQGSKRD